MRETGSVQRFTNLPDSASVLCLYYRQEKDEMTGKRDGEQPHVVFHGWHL